MRRLEGKNVYYIITGAPKAKHAPEIITEMVSEGANVFTIPTKNSGDFVDIESLKKIQGNLVKCDWGNETKLPPEDVVLIAPCTFNTLNALVSGKADSYPLCLVASSLGKKIPVFIAPAMNKTLWDHPLIQENIKKLELWGCQVIWPEIIQDRVTMIDIGKILDTLYFKFKRINYEDKRINENDLMSILDGYKKKYQKEFSDIGNFLKENNLNLYTAGCMSVRVPEGFLITSSGSDMSALAEENISLVRSWDENSQSVEWCGNFMPSSETPLHCILHEEKKYRIILHIHCPKMTYSSNLEEYNSERYMRYGTFAIGHKAKEMLSRSNFFIMKYHGEVVSGNETEELKKILLKFYEKA